LKLATDFAVKIASCKTKEELDRVRAEVQSEFVKNPQFKKEWCEWLRDCRDSKLFELGLSDEPFENCLNEKGKAWYKEKFAKNGKEKL